MDVSSVTSTELGYLHGVTGAIQTQLDAKQAAITGAATTIVSSDLTESKALVSNSAGKVAVSSVTSTELGYLHGVTSAIQTQLTAKANRAAPEFTTSLKVHESATASVSGTTPKFDVNVAGTHTEIKVTDLPTAPQPVSQGNWNVLMVEASGSTKIVTMGPLLNTIQSSRRYKENIEILDGKIAGDC